MSKSEEIAAIELFTAKLPRDSYLAPWLHSIMPQIRFEIGSDFPVSPSITDARKECALILDDARREAETILKLAKDKAAAIEKTARENCDRARGYALESLRQAEKQICQ